MKRLILIALFAIITGDLAAAKGGTNSHEIASTRSDDDTTSSLAGCGRGRYRDPRTLRCIGPADYPR
jgi:hypothetical protein